MVDLTVIEGGCERHKRRQAKALRDVLAGNIEVPILRLALIELQLRDMLTTVKQVRAAGALKSTDRIDAALQRLFRMADVVEAALNHPQPPGAA